MGVGAVAGAGGLNCQWMAALKADFVIVWPNQSTFHFRRVIDMFLLT